MLVVNLFSYNRRMYVGVLVFCRFKSLSLSLSLLDPSVWDHVFRLGRSLLLDESHSGVQQGSVSVCLLIAVSCYDAVLTSRVSKSTAAQRSYLLTRDFSCVIESYCGTGDKAGLFV